MSQRAGTIGDAFRAVERTRIEHDARRLNRPGAQNHDLAMNLAVLARYGVHVLHAFRFPGLLVEDDMTDDGIRHERRAPGAFGGWQSRVRAAVVRADRAAAITVAAPVTDGAVAGSVRLRLRGQDSNAPNGQAAVRVAHLGDSIPENDLAARQRHRRQEFTVR